MSVVINTNTAASIAANNLGYANNQLTDAINQLSSGSRLADPSNDPASVGVSLELTSEADNAGVQNTITQNQLAFQQTQDGVLNVAGSIVTRISELNTMAQDPTMSSTDTANYNAEFTRRRTRDSCRRSHGDRRCLPCGDHDQRCDRQCRRPHRQQRRPAGHAWIPIAGRTVQPDQP